MDRPGAKPPPGAITLVPSLIKSSASPFSIIPKTRAIPPPGMFGTTVFLRPTHSDCTILRSSLPIPAISQSRQERASHFGTASICTKGTNSRPKWPSGIEHGFQSQKAIEQNRISILTSSGRRQVSDALLNKSYPSNVLLTYHEKSQSKNFSQIYGAQCRHL